MILAANLGEGSRDFSLDLISGSIGKSSGECSNRREALLAVTVQLG